MIEKLKNNRINEKQFNKKKVGHVMLGVIICLFIVTCLFGFFRYNQELTISLRNERAMYVNEITGQLTRSITAKREWLISRVGSTASYFEQSNVTTFEEVENLFNYKKDENYTVLLASDTGSTYTIDGKTAQIRNFDILRATLLDDIPQYHFDKSSNGLDYWVFSISVEKKLIDNVNVVAIYEIYDTTQFQDDLHLGLFDDEGYTFIVDANGGVQLKPNKNAEFIGYNLISSLIKTGIDDESASIIRDDIKNQRSNSFFAVFNGSNWAVQYSPLVDSKEMAVVIAPIATTSKETTIALQYTLVTIAGAVVGLAILVLSIIIINVRTSKERDRHMYELELKDRVASTKNNFLAKMSHDIRTPLNAIIGMNYIASREVKNDKNVKEALTQIDTSAKYLLGILNDILDMSKIESGKMELRHDAFAGREIIETIVAISRKQAAEKGLTFNVQIADNLAESYIGDKQRLAQILMNLTNNAIKYTNRGGTVNVRFTVEERNNNIDKIHLIVEDTGIGMSEEYMKNLFTPFTQDNTNIGSAMTGSGLGLSIVKSFVDMMGGTIDVQSVKDVGSTFDVTIELERTDIVRLEEEKNNQNIDESILIGKRVLVVEDNDINLVIAENIISGFGIIVDTAINGRLALEKYQEREIGYYDIIITDIQMPVMNGYELTEAVRSLDRDDAKKIPILAMSANAFDDDYRASLLHGMNSHLKKPIDVAELKKVLLKYLQGGE